MRHISPSVLLLLLAACTTADPWREILVHEDRRVPKSSHLHAILRHEDPKYRARAALAMGRIQSMAYAPALIEMADTEEDKTVRLTAIFALGQLGLGLGAEVLPDATQACIRALKTEDDDIVAAALEAMGKLAAPGVGKAVLPFLKHPSSLVRSEACLALMRVRFVPVWRREVKSPRPLPPEAVEALIGALSDDVARVRWSAAYAFSRYGQSEAVPKLRSLLIDENEWVRLFAVRAIGRSGNQAAAQTIMLGRTDPSDRVRTETINAAASLGGADLIPLGLVEDESFHVRAALARALGRSSREKTIETLRKLEKDGSFTVAAAAIGSLARRLRGEYREALEGYLGDHRWVLRVAAAGAAGHLGSEGIPLLVKAMQDDDNRVRAAALEVMGDKEGVDELILQGLESDDLAVRGTAVFVVADGKHPKKLEWLRRVYETSSGVDWVEIREAVVGGLEDREDKENIRPLREAVDFLQRIEKEDPAPSVRNKARFLLRRGGYEIGREEPPPIDLSPFLGQTYETDPIVVLETDAGDIEIRCLPGEAPIHVANFVRLVRDGKYDGLIWHRVVSNFVIQGGDPRGDGWGGPGYNLRDEINRTRYDRGMVGMPKAGKDTGGCQIFITHTPTPHLDGNYTVFGHVISGMEVVDKIEVGDVIKRAFLR